MKVKTSITLSQDVLQTLERLVPERQNRSEVIEAALWQYIRALQKKLRDGKDLAILNKRAASLNDEAEDALGYQADL